MTLKPGQLAPPFQTRDMSGQNISLADYNGKRLLLSFIKETFSAGLKPGKMEGTYSRLPSDFLIDEDLKIARAYYATDITQHMPFAVIDGFLSPV